MEPLFNATEIAGAYKISRSRAYLLLKNGEIPAVRIGRSVRARRSDVEAFIVRQVAHKESARAEALR